MRIEAVCTKTGLSQVVVQCYQNAKLVEPQKQMVRGRMQTIFNEADVALLGAIAVTRRAGFTIEEVHTMMADSSRIAPTAALLMRRLYASARQQSALGVTLEGLNYAALDSFLAFADAISAPAIRQPLPREDLVRRAAPDALKVMGEREKRMAVIGRYLTAILLLATFAAAVVALVMRPGIIPVLAVLLQGTLAFFVWRGSTMARAVWVMLHFLSALAAIVFLFLAIADERLTLDMALRLGAAGMAALFIGVMFLKNKSIQAFLYERDGSGAGSKAHSQPV